MSNRSLPVEQRLRFEATQEKGEVSAILLRPEKARWLLVLGHGAGAGMEHSSMVLIANELAAVDIATFRYQFPYMERGKGGMDSEAVRLATVRAAINAAADAAPDLPLIAGGKSMGGRMTSITAAKAPLPGVKGIVFFGFPLHPSGKPDDARGEHLFGVTVPMLFLQGTRDKLADLDLLRPICERLGENAALHIIDTADHGFKVLKRSGKTLEEVHTEMAQTVASWAATKHI